MATVIVLMAPTCTSGGQFFFKRGQSISGTESHHLVQAEMGRSGSEKSGGYNASGNYPLIYR
jgi:hypothetical protein